MTNRTNYQFFYSGVGGWVDRAACTHSPEEIKAYFFERKNKKKQAIAKKVCETCPVITECLEHAVTKHEYWGIWGGRTASERTHPNGTITLRCPVCGVVFKGKGGARYCSPPCRLEAEATRKSTTPQQLRACLECNTYFVPKSAIHKYCCDSCQRIYCNRRKQEERREERIKFKKPETPCPQCGTLFVRPRERQTYCSVGCAQQANKKRYSFNQKGKRAEEL